MVDQSCKPWLDHPVGRPSPIFAWHHPCVSLRLRKSQSLPAEDGANQRIKEALHFNFNATSQLRPKLVFLPWADVHGTWSGTSRSHLAMPCYACYPFHPCAFYAFYASRGRHWWLSLSHCVPHNATVAFRHFIRIGAVKSVKPSLVHNFITFFQNNVIQVVTWDMVIKLRMISCHLRRSTWPDVTNFNTCNMWVYDGLRLQSRGCMWRPPLFHQQRSIGTRTAVSRPNWPAMNLSEQLDWYCISFIMYIKAQDHL